MKKMMALISALAVLMIAFSGCVGNGNSAVNRTEPGTPGANAISNGNAVDIGKLGNLSGFEYIGSFSLNETIIKENYNAENISGIVGGSEALYKQNKTDLYVDVIELKDTEAANNLITTYKSSFPPLENNNSRFVEESFNGHSVVNITNYVTSEICPQVFLYLEQQKLCNSSFRKFSGMLSCPTAGRSNRILIFLTRGNAFLPFYIF